MISRKYILVWAIIIHLLMMAICVFAFRDNVIWLLCSELFVVISASISIWVWHSLSQSAKVSSFCLDMINEQDFSSLLRHVGYPEADRMIDVYNRMIAELREQRLQVRGKNEFLDLLVEASPMGVIIMDFDRLVTLVNPAAAKFLQMPAAELSGRRLKEFGSTMTQALSGLTEGVPEIVEAGD